MLKLIVLLFTLVHAYNGSDVQFHNMDDTTEFPAVPTEPPVEMIKCYKCDSKLNACTEDSFGEPGDCPKTTGCSLSLGDGVFLRTCGDSETDFNCATTDEAGMTLKYCNCQTELCNKNWDTAAGLLGREFSEE
eukprot:TRINITY_DN12194_c0_g1_i1.p1 TRINITY_DN12194_c0_g1~~TRINITY_DN12194_c0_g1_i1.p1  ORF type:complete len:133 (+),score=29.43 TRINITY_DN12194_c0_g1_i1:122-520(+)